MNRVSQRMLSHILITILGWPCLLLAGSASGLGTPPQKPTQSNAIGSNAVILEADDLRAAPDSTSTMLLRMEKGAQMRLLLSLASNDSAEIELLRGHVISRQEAKQYAQATELHASDVTYIAAPNQSQFSAQ